MFGRTKADDDLSSPNGRNYCGDYNSGHDGDTAMDPDSGVKRGLKNRHLSMMALAGIIGPGLLVGSGGALHSGGPASLLIGFGVIGMFLSAECFPSEMGEK